ncbi:membrane protein [Streptomyces longispororuber]|uniref:Membrane protein n=1 Tax=Streptomyces longispororuber TaxID=68230 RepID=A0A919E1E3_9ACTN|nr:MMPL family transporter [Streptomyces longispororuber]GHF00516.1 membrane protein [Streptomyces longispororuber]
MFKALGRFVVGHRWLVIISWLIAGAAVIGFAPSLTTTSDQAEFLPDHYESIQAQKIQEKAFPKGFSPSAIVVFSREDGKALTAADSAKVDKVGKALKAKKYEKVEQVVTAPPSPHKKVQTVMVSMTDVKAGDKGQQHAVEDMRDDLKSLVAKSGLKAGVTGDAATQLDNEEASKKADSLIFLGTIILIVVLMTIIFRSPTITVLTIVGITLVAQVANGLIATCAKVFHLKADSSVSSLLIVVLFGVGTDYILFLMFRYRERLRLGEDPKTAMVSAVGRVGEAIASAAGAVVVCFLALLLSSLSFLVSMGPALAIAIGVTLLACLTLIPAVISLMGTKVFWPSKSWQREPRAARFGALGRSVARHPGRYVVASGLLMIVCAVGALGYKPTFASQEDDKSTKESQVALHTMSKDLPAGSTNPSSVLMRSTSGEKLDEGDMKAFVARLKQVKGVGDASRAQVSKDGTTAEFNAVLTMDPNGREAMDVVRGPLRTAAHEAAPPGTETKVGGITSVFVDINKAVNRDFSVVFPTAAALIMLILGLLLRSAVAPVYLMVSVALGFGATLGASVLLFQEIQGQAGLTFFLPVIMYLFVVAIGTDYNILMVARLREEAKEGLGPREATAKSIQHAGPTVAAAGVILAGTFASMLLASDASLAQIGFAVAFGIMISAFVMAMFFTPALTALFGRAAWWPRRIRPNAPSQGGAPYDGYQHPVPSQGGSPYAHYPPQGRHD